MRPSEMEARMRELECYHSLRIVPGTWSVLRVDGRGFSRFTESRFDKPFDPRFHDLMTQTARRLLEDFGAVYAYTESDEISLLFRPGWSLFDRELEKVVSLSAGLASAAFTHAAGEVVQFDSRVWLGPRKGLVVDYFRWRQADAARCARNGWCYWTLRQSGATVAAATEALVGKGVAAKNELLFHRGINFNDLPAWQRRGTGLYWEDYEKEGFNPRDQQAVTCVRRRVKEDHDLPIKEDYGRLLRRLMAAPAK